MEHKERKILIDLEFTGLDNTFINDNEIIQVKLFDLDNNKQIIKNFYSKKKLTAHVQLEHLVERYENEPIFSLEEFEKMLTELASDSEFNFYGFSIEKDIEMLDKYGIKLNIIDIKKHFQKSNFAYRMATEGHGLEECYLIIVGEHPPKSNHADFSEMFLIKALYDKMNEVEADEFLSIVPFGHCSGMDIKQYVIDYRKQADGYRYNNNDDFSRSLDFAINNLFDEDYIYPNF